MKKLISTISILLIGSSLLAQTLVIDGKVVKMGPKWTPANIATRAWFDASDTNSITADGFGAVSGWAESYVDSQDHSAVAVSGWAGTNFLTAVSDDTTPSLGGELNLDNNDIVVDCKNSTGATIYKGTPVYVSGYYSSNGKPLISVARADTASKMPALGILNADLANGAEGTVGIMGVVSHQNTNSFTVGNTIYVAPTGGLTNVKPTGITHKIQNLGFVTRKDASQGRIVLLGAGRSNDIPLLPQPS